MRHSVRDFALLALGVAAIVALSISLLHAQPDRGPQVPNTFDAARQKYEADLQRPSLFIRTRSAERMASYGDPRGMDLLIRRYQRPTDEPHDHVRYTTASICGEFYNGAAFVEKWQGWIQRSNRDADSWLWFKAQQVLARHGDTAEVMRGLLRQRNGYLRAATLEALAMIGRQEALEAIPQLIGDRVPGGVNGMLLLEACASVLYRLKHELGTDLYKEAATHVIRQLGERRTDKRTKLVIARHLKAIFNEPDVHDNVDAWMQSLERGQANQEARDGGQSGVRFMNVPAVGDRIAFIIDFSDSMLEPLTADEREELRGPTSGGNGGGNQGDDLPWDRITNRFELAREELKRSISNLPEALHFCVIVYGDEAKPLGSTSRLVPASTRYKRAVISELDNYRPGPARSLRPHGTLMGATNVHGGLLQAFRITDRVVLPGEEHIAEAGFTSGVDTIFLLSDGVPTTDDFMMLDERDPEDLGGDPEAGAVAADQTMTHLRYHGPYVRRLHQINHLLDDLYRMNLHRKCEIHTIGIGEFDPGLLEAIAAIGMGHFRSIKR